MLLSNDVYVDPERSLNVAMEKALLMWTAFEQRIVQAIGFEGVKSLGTSNSSAVNHAQINKKKQQHWQAAKKKANNLFHCNVTIFCVSLFVRL